MSGAAAWRRASSAAVLAAVICLLGCTPNLVVGTREPDAGRVDASQPTAEPDAGSMTEMPPATPPDAGRVEDAGTPPPVDAGVNMNTDMQGDGGIECTTSTECTDSDEPHCVVAEGRCVECLTDDHCMPDELCEDDNECGARPVPCTSEVQCGGTEDPVCHPTLQVCVECASDTDCPRDETCQPDNECD